MEQCPFKNNVYECKCNTCHLSLTHHKDVAYYPKAGWLRMGRRLFRLRWVGAHGQHFWDCLVRLSPAIGMVNTTKEFKACYVSFTTVLIQDTSRKAAWGGVDFLHIGIWPWMGVDGIVSPIVLVWRIQRAVRRFLKRRFEERALAWMMGSLTRLCGTAGMADIPEDISRRILAA